LIFADLSIRGAKRAVIRGDHGTYVTDEEFCSCPSGVFRGTCKHRVEVLKMPLKVSELKDKVRTFPSSLEGLNKAFGGPLYNDDALVTFYGKYHIGKTLLIFQDMCFLNTNVLWIDAEGGMKNMAQKWFPVFKERFGDVSEIFLETRKSLSDLTEFVGFRTRTEFHSKAKDTKGKMDFQILETLKDSEIEDVIKAEKIGAIVLDSISSPVRQIMSDDQQNNPAKATAQSLILGRLLQLQDRYGLALVVTAHASVNPANQYATSMDVRMRGGLVLHHFSKRVIYIDARETKELRDYRRLWIVRSEDEPRFSAVVGAKVSDIGFEDYDDVATLLTDAEAKYLKVD